MNDTQQTADAVRRLREERGLKQWELAKILGITPSTLSYIECGHKSPSAELSEKLCEALGCTEEDIFGKECSRSHPQNAAIALEEKLIEKFENLNSDYKHLLLVRAHELMLLQKEKEQCFKAAS